MPNGPDKIIINHGGLRAYRAIIRGWFKGISIVLSGAMVLNQEIEEGGWSQDPDALAFLAEQEVDCAEIDNACERFLQAQAKFYSRQMDRNDRMRRWIDKKLAQQKTP